MDMVETIVRLQRVNNVVAFIQKSLFNSLHTTGNNTHTFMLVWYDPLTITSTHGISISLNFEANASVFTMISRKTILDTTCMVMNVAYLNYTTVCGLYVGLSFHSLDGEDYLFTISLRSVKYSLQKLKKILKKCCATCQKVLIDAITSSPVPDIYGRPMAEGGKGGK